MFIEFKHITFKNILSYGNNETSFNFTQGLNSIVGKNGQGKSTFLDAMSFCLYGVPYRNIKIQQLINRTNKKKLETECTFIKDKIQYVIKRTLSPSSISIKKGPVGVEGKDLELLSSKKLFQEEIDKIIGIDAKLFKQIICLAISYNKPYLSLKSGEKRDIIESIFNIKVFGDMLRNIKKENVGLKTEQTINSKTISILESSLSTQRKQLNNFKTTSKNFKKNKEHELSVTNQNIKQTQQELTFSEKEIKILLEEMQLLDVSGEDECKDNIANFQKEETQFEYQIKQDKKTIENLTSNDYCPMCNTELSEKHIKGHILELQESIQKTEEELEPIRLELVFHRNALKTIREDKVKIRELEKNLNNHEYKKSMDEKKIIGLTNSLETIKNKELDFDINSIENDFEEKIGEYKTIFKKNKNIGKDIGINKIVENVLSENGIKAHFFRKLLPILNNKINNYLKLFELNIILTFDAFMDERITSMNGQHDLPYMSFSEGEKKRIDLSILLSFIDTTKSITNWNCNLLFFDELFDSATDTDGLDKITSTVKGMTESNNKLCVYVISHRINDDTLFDQQINVYKNGNYSRVVKVEN